MFQKNVKLSPSDQRIVIGGEEVEHVEEYVLLRHIVPNYRYIPNFCHGLLTPF